MPTGLRCLGRPWPARAAPAEGPALPIPLAKPVGHPIPFLLTVADYPLAVRPPFGNLSLRHPSGA